MTSTQRFLLLFVFLFNLYYATAQSITYSAIEAEQIHDSINHSRWDIGGPVSKYSFRYMSEFFSTATINKSTQPYQFRFSPSKSINAINIKAGDKSLNFENYLRSLHMVAFIVVQKGAIVYEKYFSMLTNDQHTLQSVNKVITSTLISSLANEKRIDISQPIEKYIPELSASDWKGISVRDILNMRSGMDIRSVDFESGPFTNPLHKNYQLESALGILRKTDKTPTSVYQYLATMKRDTLPGLEASYSNLNTFVLGWLAEKVTGKKYNDLVSERIWGPMGASSNAYVCLSDKGIAWPHGGISATLRDLARFGMMYTHSEIKAKKESLISFSQLKEIFAAKPINSPFGPFKWGYQWDMASDGIMMKGGFGGQALYVVPEQDIVIACYNYIDKDWGMNLISESALNELLKALRTGK